MLEIIVNNKTRLQLPSNVAISIVQENPLLMDDRIPSSYSLSFEVPATPGNLSALGYPNRITSSGIIARQPGKILHNGLLIGTGEILLIETTDALKLQFKGSPVNGNLVANLNSIENDDYDFGMMGYNFEDIDYSDACFEDYVLRMRTTAMQGSPFVLAPVKINGATWQGSEFYGGAKNGLLNYINYWNPGNNNWFTGGDAMHMPVVPFPYVKDTIDKAFGTHLQSNPFAANGLEKLVTVSCNHPYYNFASLFYKFSDGEDWFERLLPLLDSYDSINYQIPLTFNIKSFMQAYAFNSFLKNLLKVFSMSAYPGMQYVIEKNNDTFNRDVVKNWDGKLAGKPLIKTEEAKDYNFKYSDSGEANDNYTQTTEDVKHIYDAAIAATTDEEMQFVDAVSNARYGITKTLHGLQDNIRLTTNTQRSALSVKERDTGKEKHAVESDVCPLDMSIEQWWKDDKVAGSYVIEHNHWYVPVMDIPEVTGAPKIMLFGGMANTLDGTGEYPLLLNHHTDHFGVKRLNTSLLIEGADGLLSTYHSGMKSWVEKDKQRVSGSFRLTPAEIRNVDLRDKIYLKGRLFYIEKMEYTLTHRGVSLVDVDLIEC